MQNDPNCDENGFFTEAGWKEIRRIAQYTFTQEQRMIKVLLREIERRDILLKTAINVTLDPEG